MIPTPYVIGLHRYTPTITGDSSPLKVWTPAKTAPGIKFFIQGWAPKSADPGDTEPVVDRSVAELSAYLPPVLHEATWDAANSRWLKGAAIDDPTALDVIDLPIRWRDLTTGAIHDWTQLEIVGPVLDYTNGPFGWQPGKIINLRRVTG